MSAQAHLVELTVKHQALEKRISEELARPASDEVKIRRWKHEKLKIKEQMEKLKTTIH